MPRIWTRTVSRTKTTRISRKFSMRSSHATTNPEAPSRRIVRSGSHVFTHVTKFACVKQPPGGKKDVYYALHHMRALVRDQQQLTLPSHRKLWAELLSEIQDADLRQEFFRIQSDLAGIISEDVLRRTGEFHVNNQLPNSEIETMLRLQADGDRSFMTITKDGGFVHAPARERSQKS